MKGIFKRRGKKLTAVATAFALLCSGGVLPEHIWQVSAETSEAGEEALAVNEENFPDEGLRKQVKLAADKDNDDILSRSELESFTTLFAYGDDGNNQVGVKIKNLAGIEKLTYLKYLRVDGNDISGDLDLNGWPNLIEFSCSDNPQITSVDLSSQTELFTFRCDGTQIKKLDLSHQTNLIHIECSNTPIKTLDLGRQSPSSVREIPYVVCRNSNLTNIILANGQTADNVYCEGNTTCLFQESFDFNDTDLFPGLDTARLQEVYKLRGEGDRQTKSSILSAIRENDYVVKDLKPRDKIVYTYNCAAVASEAAINIDFTVIIGYRDNVTPPNCPDTGNGYDTPYTSKCVGEAPLPEGWEWAEEDKDKELAVGVILEVTAVYVGENAEYYSEKQRTIKVRVLRDVCKHTDIIHHEAKVPTATEAGNIEYYECLICGCCFKEKDGDEIYSDVILPSFYVVDNVESTTTHVGYESGISNLDVFKVKLNDNPGVEVKKSIGVSSFEIEQVTYQKEDASEKEVLTDNGGFMVRMSDFALRLTESDPEISLGGLSCDKKPDCGTYTIDLKLNVWKLDGTGGQDIPMQRTIVVDRADIQQLYSQDAMKIEVNGQDISEGIDTVYYTGKEVCPEVKLTTGDSDEVLTEGRDYIIKYDNNVEVNAEKPATITICGTGNYTGQYVIKFSIKKRSEAPGMPEADLKVPYTIRAVGEVSLDAKWKWASGDSEKALPVGEKVTVTAEYIGDDADLYENIKQEVTIIRQACEHPEEKLVLQGEKDNSCVDGYSGDYFCTQCNEIVERGEIRPARHNLTLVEAQPATDTVPGNIAYYVCNDCGKYFEDSDGTQETTPEKVTIPASGTSTPGLTPTPTLGATESPAATQSPSQTPGTAEPTGEPEKTGAPTNVPETAEPTGEPERTEAPTKEPVETNVPTGVPTDAPAGSELPVPAQNTTPVANQNPAAQEPAATIPAETKQETPSSTPVNEGRKPAKVGKIIKDSQGNRYKVTSSNLRKPTVKFYSPGAKVKKVVISERVRIDGIYYYVTALGSRAFERNRKVTSVRLGIKVNTIGDRAFRNCRKLRDLYIQCMKLKPDDIGNRVFDGVCSGVRVSVPRSKLEEYRKMLQDKGLKKTVPVTYGKIK